MFLPKDQRQSDWNHPPPQNTHTHPWPLVLGLGGGRASVGVVWGWDSMCKSMNQQFVWRFWFYPKNPYINFILQNLRYSCLFECVLFFTSLSIFMIQEDGCGFVIPPGILLPTPGTMQREMSNRWITEDLHAHSISSFIYLSPFLPLSSRSLPIRHLYMLLWELKLHMHKTSLLFSMWLITTHLWLEFSNETVKNFYSFNKNPSSFFLILLIGKQTILAVYIIEFWIKMELVKVLSENYFSFNMWFKEVSIITVSMKVHL